jgi:hypothetical protein
MGAIPDDGDGSTAFNGIQAWDETAQPDGQLRWNSFVTRYTLQNITDTGTQPAPYVKKSIYFLPVCKFTQPAGLTGGENFGILAEIPVLVR